MEDLANVVSFEGFSFSVLEYRNGEQTILKPQLEKLGYTDVHFFMGERDSFGPLSRVVTCVKDGQPVSFYYG